jgi:hypothetical protein
MSASDIWKHIRPELLKPYTCKNDPAKRYTGKERSPLGRGFSPSAGVATMKGGDGRMWVVQKRKENYTWVRKVK